MAGSAALAGGAALGQSGVGGEVPQDAAFRVEQIRRRKELWGLLGDLPWEHQPAAPKHVRTENHDG